jgi:hypothetical protein
VLLYSTTSYIVLQQNSRSLTQRVLPSSQIIGAARHAGPFTLKQNVTIFRTFALRSTCSNPPR